MNLYFFSSLSHFFFRFSPLNLVASEASKHIATSSTIGGIYKKILNFETTTCCKWNLLMQLHINDFFILFCVNFSFFEIDEEKEQMRLGKETKKPNILCYRKKKEDKNVYVYAHLVSPCLTLLLICVRNISLVDNKVKQILPDGRKKNERRDFSMRIDPIWSNVVPFSHKFSCVKRTPSSNDDIQ